MSFDGSMPCMEVASATISPTLKSVVMYWGKRADGVGHGGRIGRENLLGNGAQHQALIGRAVAVAVAVLVIGVARAAQNERLFAGQRLLARIHMSAGLVVVDLHGHIHFHAAQGIHDLLDAVEVDLGIVEMGTPAICETVLMASAGPPMA